MTHIHTHAQRLSLCNKGQLLLCFLCHMIHIQADTNSQGEESVLYQRMLFPLNQYNVYTKRIVFHWTVCFYLQQSVLAALYSSEGSVMEVNSQPVTSHHKEEGELTMVQTAWGNLGLYKYLPHVHSVATLLGTTSQSNPIQSTTVFSYMFIYVSAFMLGGGSDYLSFPFISIRRGGRKLDLHTTTDSNCVVY